MCFLSFIRLMIHLTQTITSLLLSASSEMISSSVLDTSLSASASSMQDILVRGSLAGGAGGPEPLGAGGGGGAVLGRGTQGGGGGAQLGLLTLTRAGDLVVRLLEASSSGTVVRRVSVLLRDFLRFKVGVLHF